MAGTEDLSQGAGVVVGLGGHKGLLLQCWSGVTCPALYPGAPVSCVWRGEDRLRCCCFLVSSAMLGGYKATHTHCSAGRSRCKQTRVFPVSCWLLLYKLWSVLPETRLKAHFSTVHAVMLVSSAGPDVQTSLQQIKDVSIQPLFMLMSLVDMFEECKPFPLIPHVFLLSVYVKIFA